MDLKGYVGFEVGPCDIVWGDKGLKMYVPSKYPLQAQVA